MNFLRVWAIFLRQYFLIRKSFQRVLGIFYWSALELFVWGAMTIYLDRVGQTEFSFIALILGAVILWNLLGRVQHGITVSFLEDVWTRNLINLFASPLRVSEYMAGLLLTSLVEVVAAFLFLSGISRLLFAYNVFSFGWYLLPFVAVLFLFGWALGIFATAIILRLGPSSEILAWSIPAFLSPLSGVTYPIATLPPALRTIAAVLPSSQVFEGMRSLVLTGAFDIKSLAFAFLLSVGFLLLSYLFLLASYRNVLKKGLFVRFVTE